MTEVSTITGPGAPPERGRLRESSARLGPYASVVLGASALVLIWAGALLADDEILAAGRHAFLLAATLPTAALVPLVAVVVVYERGLARARDAAAAGTRAAQRPVVALTADADPGDVSAFLAVGQTAPADETEQQPLIDRSAVDEFIEEIGAEAAERMFATFLMETERRLSVLRGLSCDDRAAIAFEAHTLIGSSGTFGMMRLSWLARELERRSATIAAGAYPAAVQRLLEVYGGSRHELLDYLEKVASTRAAAEN